MEGKKDGMRAGEVRYMGQSWEMNRVMLGNEIECQRREAKGGEEGAGQRKCKERKSDNSGRLDCGRRGNRRERERKEQKERGRMYRYIKGLILSPICCSWQKKHMLLQPLRMTPCISIK